MEQYKLHDFVHNGYVLVEICKGMYGLPEAVIITNERLAYHLAEFGYAPTKHTPGLFTHADITFFLVIDDFGVNNVGREHAEHPVKTFQSIYTTKCLYGSIR
jgi:hypothetical protein